MRRYVASSLTAVASLAFSLAIATAPVLAAERDDSAAEPSRVDSPRADSPQGVISDATERLVGALSTHADALGEDQQLAYDIAREVILPHVDFTLVARWVLGRHWRAATPAQRERFIAEFRTFLTRNYVSAMVKFVDEIVTHADKVRYPAVSYSEDRDDAMVRTVIRLADGSSVPVDYRMRRREQGWKIYDVVIEGVSLAGTYRASFRDQIARVGMDGLIADLASRAASN